MQEFLTLVIFIVGVSAVPMNIFGNQYPFRSPRYDNSNAEANPEMQSYYSDYDPVKIIRHAELNGQNATIETPNITHSVEPPPPAPLQPIPSNEHAIPKKIEDSIQNTQLQKMVQELYMAQGQVQLEASEIQRAQTIASAAQHNLEESSNNVRVITAALRAAQETVANAALRAQTAQLQLAAHDQLLFTARQKVDALSAQMVALQAEVGITADTRMSIDLPALLNRLKQPLSPDEQPKPINPMEHNTTNSEDTTHPLIIHSADPNAFIQPQQSNSASDGKQRRSLEADDVRDMLDWVRHQKSAEIAKASDGSPDAFNAKRSADYSRKFVRDFVSNMQSLNRIDGTANRQMNNEMVDNMDRDRWNRASEWRRSRGSAKNRRRRSHMREGMQK